MGLDLITYCCFCGKELYHWSFLHCGSGNCDETPRTPEAAKRVEEMEVRHADGRARLEALWPGISS